MSATETARHANGLDIEVEASLKAGARQMTLPVIRTELRRIGYEIDPGTRAAGVFRNLDTGNNYPGATYGVCEIDTRMSAFHYQARRDANFRALQEFRQWTFTVSGGRMVTI